MYKINKSENNIQKLSECTFSEIDFKERKHLQELLIIQKEFSDFEDTKERLDFWSR